MPGINDGSDIAAEIVNVRATLARYLANGHDDDSKIVRAVKKRIEELEAHVKAHNAEEDRLASHFAAMGRRSGATAPGPQHGRSKP